MTLFSAQTGWCCSPQFADEEKGSERLSDLPIVTQQLGGSASMGTQTSIPKSLHCLRQPDTRGPKGPKKGLGLWEGRGVVTVPAFLPKVLPLSMWLITGKGMQF